MDPMGEEICQTPWFRRKRVKLVIYKIHGVADWNPAPAGTVNIPLNTRFYTSQVVQDSFHQQYQLNMKNLAMIFYEYLQKLYNYLSRISNLALNVQFIYRGPKRCKLNILFHESRQQ